MTGPCGPGGRGARRFLLWALLGALLGLAPGLVGATPVSHSEPVTFDASGLHSGTSWQISVQGTIEHSTTSSIVFQEPPGSYVAVILEVPSYSSNVTSIPFSVLATPLTFEITFTVNNSQIPTTGGSGGGGSSPTASTISPVDWTLVIVVLGGAVLGWYYLVGRKRGARDAATEEEEAPPARSGPSARRSKRSGSGGSSGADDRRRSPRRRPPPEPDAEDASSGSE